MKTTLSIACMLCILSLAVAVPTRSTQRKVCKEGRMTNLAACGCFVQATSPNAAAAAMEVCHKLYGDNLLMLKSSCENFMAGDVVDVDSVSEAIEEVKKDCLSELLPIVSRKAVDGQSLEHVSERILPYLIAAALLLYAPSAH